MRDSATRGHWFVVPSRIWPICGLLLSGLSALAQSRPATVFDTASANLPAQPIGANDLLSIHVYDAPELSRTVRVSSDGYIKVPILPSRLRVAGKLPLELETLIATALIDAEILVKPLVTVSLAEYHSRPINVIGAVKNPLTFQADGPTTLLEALAKAGGLTDNAASEILVTSASVTTGEARRGPDALPTGEELAPGSVVAASSSRVETVHILVKHLLNGSDPSLNRVLSGGEEISVPAAGRVVILGNVKKPGAYPVRDSSEGTVLQILALAEGLTVFSTKDAYIYRPRGSDPRAEIPVKLDAILKRKSPDVPLLPDDILYIPDDKGRRLGMAALERVLMFGSTAGATALIYGGVR